MAQKTDLNVAPYYDDFKEDKNFHRILFRSGFITGPRELTQLQSILQNQIERFGNHVFQEGTLVIPGGLSVNKAYDSIKLSSALLGKQLMFHNTIMQQKPVTIVGATSGVKARVVGFKEQLQQLILYYMFNTFPLVMI